MPSAKYFGLSARGTWGIAAGGMVLIMAVGCARERIARAPRFDDVVRLAVETRANTFTFKRQQEACLDVAPDGSVLVVWTSLRQESGTSGVYAQLVDPAGRHVGPERHVNQYRPGSQCHPSVSIDDRGLAWIVWESYGQDGDRGGIVGRCFRVSPSGLMPVSDEFAVNQQQAGHQVTPVVTADGSGGALCVWTSATKGRNAAAARFFSAPATPATSEFLLSLESDTIEALPTATRLGDGRYAVVWAVTDQSGRHGRIVGCVLCREGADIDTAEATSFAISEPDGRTHVEPSVSADRSGRFTVAWMRSGDEPGYDVTARVFDAQGAALSPTITVAEAGNLWKERCDGGDSSGRPLRCLLQRNRHARSLRGNLPPAGPDDGDDQSVRRRRASDGSCPSRQPA